jgi:hypothetical protein
MHPPRVANQDARNETLMATNDREGGSIRTFGAGVSTLSFFNLIRLNISLTRVIIA